ncbi:hypothetical protein PUN28_016826 [Cardiocondyla obscurior]|uniref:Uncharacterized protein n=1 Tax=Cardiocondyla obscurior TaxID=286306 RepID=A0AAW2EUS7_9HYME
MAPNKFIRAGRNMPARCGTRRRSASRRLAIPNALKSVPKVRLIFKDERGVSVASAEEYREIVTPASSPSLFYDETFALSTH